MIRKQRYLPVAGTNERTETGELFLREREGQRVRGNTQCSQLVALGHLGRSCKSFSRRLREYGQAEPSQASPGQARPGSAFDLRPHAHVLHTYASFVVQAVSKLAASIVRADLVCRNNAGYSCK